MGKLNTGRGPPITDFKDLYTSKKRGTVIMTPNHVSSFNGTALSLLSKLFNLDGGLALIARMLFIYEA